MFIEMLLFYNKNLKYIFFSKKYLSHTDRIFLIIIAIYKKLNKLNIVQLEKTLLSKI